MNTISHTIIVEIKQLFFDNLFFFEQSLNIHCFFPNALLYLHLLVLHCCIVVIDYDYVICRIDCYRFWSQYEHDDTCLARQYPAHLLSTLVPISGVREFHEKLMLS